MGKDTPPTLGLFRLERRMALLNIPILFSSMSRVQMALFSKYWHSGIRTHPQWNLKEVKFYLESRGREAERWIGWLFVNLMTPGSIRSECELLEVGRSKVYPWVWVKECHKMYLGIRNRLLSYKKGTGLIRPLWYPFVKRCILLTEKKLPAGSND